jgi:hypothetical protein
MNLEHYVIAAGEIKVVKGICNPCSFLQERQKIVRDRTITIVNNYEKCDVEAVDILTRAAKLGKFNEFAERLESYYQTDLRFVHPVARKLMEYPWAKKAASFFKGCYKDLGISPKEMAKIR